MAKKSVEVMLTTKTNKLHGSFIADTATGSFKIKVEDEPYSLKYKSLANEFNKRGIDYMLDRPIQFKFSTDVNFKTDEYKEVKGNGEELTISIEPAGDGDYPLKFLKSYSKPSPEIKIKAKFLPDFDNPRM